MELKDFKKLTAYCRSIGVVNYKDNSVEFTLSPNDPKQDKAEAKELKTKPETIEEKLAKMSDEDILLYSAGSFNDKDN